MTRRLSLAGRYVWVARPLWVLMMATALVMPFVLGLLDGWREAVGVGVLLGLFGGIGHVVTVPRRVAREVIEQQRYVSPPM